MSESTPPGENKETMFLHKPLIVMFEQDGHLTCHLWPQHDHTHEHFGIMIADLVRHTARAFKVAEEDVWELVDKERHKQTTSFTSPS